MNNSTNTGETIQVRIRSLLGQQLYEPRYLEITPEGVVGCDNSRNLGFYLGYCTKEQYEERVVPIRKAMEKYNSIVKTLWGITGFGTFFAENNSFVSKEDISKCFGDKVASLAFSLKSPPYCYPDLIVNKDIFQLNTAGYRGAFSFKDRAYSFDIDGQEDSYPDKIDGKICFWNWNENNTDYALGFAKYVEECLPKGVSIFTEVLAQFDYYEQWRGEYRPIVKAINEIFSSMEQRGYLKSYILKADNYQKIWDYFTGMVAGTVGLYMCDPKAFKDKLLVERINVLLEACSIEYNGNSDPIYGLLVEKDTDQPNLDLPHYFLQDANNKTYLSKKPGTLGGHYKLKIYGRLDCPSAARYIAKGQYVRHRVFFEDEDTAIAAGYRPCGICMKEAYRKWKENHLSGDKRQ